MNNPATPFSSLVSASLWVAVAGVGVAGLVFAPGDPTHATPPAARATPPVERIEVPYAAQSESGGADSPVSEASAVRGAPDEVPPTAPEVSAVAEGSTVAFAVPVAVPSRIVGKGDASSGLIQAQSAGAPGGTGGAPVAKLTFGRGAGRQPAPPYPQGAVREGREGTVTVRFAVDSRGGVMIAKVTSTSGHALLDEAALETVRRRWRFSPGTPRVYEVDILFRLER